MNMNCLEVMAQSMRNASVPYGVIDGSDFNFQFINSAFEQLLWGQGMHLGLTQEECTDQLRPIAQRCAETGLEQVHIWGPNHLRIVMVPVFDDGQLLGIQCFAHAGQQVESEHLQETLNGLPVGLWMATAEGKFVWVNRANPLYQAGVEIEDYLASGIWLDRIHPNDLQRCASFFTQTVLQGHVEPCEIRIFMEDGKAHWFSIDGGPVPTSDGRISGWAGVAVDIQRYKDQNEEKEREIAALQQQLQEQSERIEALNVDLARLQKMDLVGQLAGNIAHDFNNLLFVIRLNTSLLKSNPDPKVAEIAKMILSDVGRAARTATELMTFSGRQPKLPKGYSVQSLIQDMERLLQRAAGEELNLYIEVEDDVGHVHVDKTYFENALMNLVINARDATAGSGCIKVKAQNTRTQQDGNWQEWVEISVTDNGCGMDEATLKRVFEPFFTTKDVGKGAGLGMPMVARFAEQSNGQIQVDSVVNQGTKVTILLPSASEQEHVRENVMPVPIEELQGKEHIFLLEDDLHVRNAVARLLIAHGYMVTPAPTPDAALEYLRNGLRPDLLLSDIRMPGHMTVVEMVQHMDDENLQCPILFMTGYSADISLLSERFTVLQKPVTEEVLLYKIRRILQEQPQTVDLEIFN